MVRLAGQITLRRITAMIPIQELLTRTRWDKQFAKDEFAIGCYDRIKSEIVTVPLRAVQFTAGDHYFAFQFCGEEGEAHTVPFHRIREVRKDGKLIWQRLH
jgi:uncharacterized protein (UPF0248 family)